MKLSVIMPAHNRERYVGQALRSLLRQRSDARLDIIVVDDGSTDGTTKVVESLMREAPEIRLLQQPRRSGVSAARNAGLRHLRPDTEVVSFLDSDDVSPAARFSADLVHFHADPSLDLTYGQICEIDRVDDEKLEPAKDCRIRISRGIQLAAGIFRRELIDAVGRFDEDFVQAEDTDYLFRLFERNPRYAFTDTIAVYYRRHAESLTAHRSEMRREFLRACLKSTLRRKRDPSLENPYPLVNVTGPEGEGSQA